MLEKKVFDVVIVGGGPAGLAAARHSSSAGASTAIIDDNPTLGGQIWRGEASRSNATAAPWLKLPSANMEILTGARVFHADAESRTLFAESRLASYAMRYDKLILATGAREQFLPFPGWTLPNVMAAGGLQAMAKSGLPVRGKRVVIAGTGPLLLAVAAYLVKHGANVLLVAEQASWSALVRFGLGLITHPAKIAQALGIGRYLAGVPFATSSWPVQAKGREALESVVISKRGPTRELACDYLACGFHLVPNIELAALLGCKLQHGYVEVDEFQRTSIQDIYCAGEATGIGGLDAALFEGESAGLAATGLEASSRARRWRREKLRAFATQLETAFELRPELSALAKPDTIVCRCEDVIYGQLTAHSSWRSAKLHSRCGMGACQGRVCGPATRFLFGWRPDSVRPPIFPARFENLAAIDDVQERVCNEWRGTRL